jgi:ABC-type lipoprotein release transport system permease subunit
MRLDEAKEILKEHGYKVQSLTKLKREIYNAIEPYTKKMIVLVIWICYSLN